MNTMRRRASAALSGAAVFGLAVGVVEVVEVVEVVWV